MRKLLIALMIAVAGCGGAIQSADTEGQASDTTAAPPTTALPAPTTTQPPETTTTSFDLVAGLNEGQAMVLGWYCQSAFGDPETAYLSILSGDIPVTDAMYEAVEALDDVTSESLEAALAPGCATLTFPEPEVDAESETEIAGGLMVMVFGDRNLEYQIEECPLAELNTSGVWRSGNGRQLATNTADGSEWQFSASVDGAEEVYSVEAIGPDGAPYFTAYTGASEPASFEVAITSDSAVYNSVFKDTIYQGESDTPFTMTITCDE